MRTGSFSFLPPRRQFFYYAVLSLLFAASFFVRFFHLGGIRAFIFDEVYYVPDAWSLRNLGYEAQWQTKDALVRGSADAYDPKSAAFVVHPPLGKWIISLGMWVFGPQNPFGWRFSAALCGCLLVVGVYVCCRLLFGTDVGKRAGIIAVFLTGFDGHFITTSRVAILDGFVAFFGVWALVFFLLYVRCLQRNTRWRYMFFLLCACALGAAAAVKWLGFLLILAFCIFFAFAYFVWGARAGAERTRVEGAGVDRAGAERAGVDRAGAERAGVERAGAEGAGADRAGAESHGIEPAGIERAETEHIGRRRPRVGCTTAVRRGRMRRPFAHTNLADYIEYGWRAIVRAFGVLVLSLCVYFLSWSGWILTQGGYNRQAYEPTGAFGWLESTLRGLFDFHIKIYNFHAGLNAEHAYMAPALSWPFLLRPTAFWYKYDVSGCIPHGSKCVEAINSISNPLFYWFANIAAIVAVLLLIVFLFARLLRLLRLPARGIFCFLPRKQVLYYTFILLLPVVAMYGVWLISYRHTVYHFYVVAWLPFLYIFAAFLFERLMHVRIAGIAVGGVATTVFLSIGFVVSVLFMPLWMGIVISFNWWDLTAWLPGWR